MQGLERQGRYAPAFRVPACRTVSMAFRVDCAHPANRGAAGDPESVHGPKHPAAPIAQPDQTGTAANDQGRWNDAWARVLSG